MKKINLTLISIIIVFSSFIDYKKTLISNSTRNDLLTDIVFSGLEILEITPKSVLIKRVDFSNSNQNLIASMRGDKDKGQYVLRIIKTSNKRSIKFIAHELIHLKQIYDGDLIMGSDNEYITYKGVEYNLNNIPEYMDREWEKEAYKLEKELYKKMKINFGY